MKEVKRKGKLNENSANDSFVKMQKKTLFSTKTLSLILAITMILSSFTSVFAVDLQATNTLINLPAVNANEKVNIIIELKNEPVLSNRNAKIMGAKSFLATEEADTLREQMISSQNDVQNIIKESINSEAEFAYAYTNTLNGFAAEVRVEDISKIKRLENVKSVYIDAIYEIPTPQMSRSNDMIYAPETWNVGFKGEGTLVAVIDTGVDATHELMVLSNPETVKLKPEHITTDIIAKLNVTKKNKDVVATVENLYKTTKIPYSFDYADGDVDASAGGSQHGVHVSGTIAANNAHVPDKFNGVAPECQILGMKVFPDRASGAKTSDTLAAVEDSITLGADAMNLSLGSTAGFTTLVGYPQYDYTSSFDKAREAGIIVAAAAGNDDRIGIGGTNGRNLPLASNPDTALIGSPSTCYNATSVASIENNYITLPYFSIVGDSHQITFNDTKDNFIDRYNGQTISYIHCGKGTVEDMAAISPEDIQGKFALIVRGDITFTEKIQNATSCGAIGAIVYNHAEGGDTPVGMSIGDAVTASAIGIGYSDGIRLLNSQTKSIVVTNATTSKVNSEARMMSDFTSWGATPDLKLKPEITAPGGNIYSTISNNKYQTMSGTSMATPHVAGAAALIKQYVKGNFKFINMSYADKGDAIERLMMSTATVAFDPENNIYSPRRQGSGLMNVKAAIDTEVLLVNNESGKTKIELGDKIANKYSLSFDAKNISNEDRVYNVVGSALSEQSENGLILSKSLYLKANMTIDGSPISVYTGATAASAIKSEDTYQITIPANSTVRINIDVTLDQDEMRELSEIFKNGFFVEGFIELVAQDEAEPSLSIPYMGFRGDWGSAPIFDKSNIYEPGQGFYNKQLQATVPYTPANKYLLGQNFTGTISNYKFIAIHPRSDSYPDMTMSLGLLRNVKDLKVVIKNDRNQVVRKLYDDVYHNKSYYDPNHATVIMDSLATGGTWNATDDYGNVVADGQYYYEISATVDYPGAKPQILSIPVFVDSKAPIVSSAYVTSEGDKKFMNLTIEDNHLMKAIVLEVDGETEVADFTNLLSNRVQNYKLDVTEKKNVEITVMDFTSYRTSTVLKVTDIERNPLHKPVAPTPVNPTPVAPTPVNPTPTVPSKEASDNYVIPDTALVKEVKGDTTTIKIDSKSVLKGIKESKASSITLTKPQTNTDIINIEVPKEIIQYIIDNKISLLIEKDGIEIFAKKLKEVGKYNFITKRILNEYKTDHGYSKTDMNWDITIKCDDKIISNLDKTFKIDISNVSDYTRDYKKAGVYTINDLGDLEYVMTYLNGDIISFYPPHFSPFVIMKYTKTFKDMTNHWSKEYVETMASKHIVKGKTENEFMPDDIITRAEFVTMVVRALDLKGTGKSTFSNIAKDTWYANYISLAKDAGLIEGSTYNAEGIISRLEMAKIIAKAHAILNDTEVTFKNKLSFTDLSNTSEDNKYVGYASENGLINGYPDKTFKPVENTTRAEAMTVIYKLLITE